MYELLTLFFFALVFKAKFAYTQIAFGEYCTVPDPTAVDPTNDATIYYATTDGCVLARVYSFTGVYGSFSFSATASYSGQIYTFDTAPGCFPYYGPGCAPGTGTTLVATFTGLQVSTLDGPVVFV
jgi:hypothetical protein